ncbi:MAG: hypothetical protein H6839_12865 [Planctomycetes bacterium]|nr:hypothetical protein [Planctomycetota bacterium]
MAAEQAMNDAAGAVEFLARKLHEKSASEQLPEKIDPEQAAGIDDGYRFAGGHFDHYGYTITINGSHPAYAGTTVAYHGRDQQAPITLTVQDLSSKRWIVEQEPLPKWWAVWK